MEPTIDHLVTMMSFLKKQIFMVHYSNLPLPEEANGENYRPHKTFMFTANGTMSYYGWGNVSPAVSITNIIPNRDFVYRIYVWLSDECNRTIKFRANQSDMPRAQELLRYFNNVEFLGLRFFRETIIST